MGVDAVQLGKVRRETHLTDDELSALRFDKETTADRRGSGDGLGGGRLVDELLANAVASFRSGPDLPMSGRPTVVAGGGR